MRKTALVAVGIVFSQSAWASDKAPPLPWNVNKPIVTVRKETYKKHPKPKAAAMVSVRYVGPKLERMEWQVGWKVTEWGNEAPRSSTPIFPTRNSVNSKVLEAIASTSARSARSPTS